MELRRYASIALKWLWLVVLCSLVAAGIAFQVSRTSAPVYQAAAKLLVNQSQDSSGPTYSSLLASELLSRTYAELLQGDVIIDSTLAKLGIASEDAPEVGVRVVRDTQLIELTVESVNPTLARDFANTLAEIFIQQRVQEQLGQGVESREVLSQQILDLELEMKAVASQIEAARAASATQADEIARLQGVLTQHQTTYAQLVRSQNEIELASVRSINSIKVAEAARLPVEPVRPNVPQNTILGAIVGLLLAVGIVILIEYLDDTVKNEDEIQQTVGLPTLAVISRAKNARGTRPLLSASSSWQLAESYRVLRTNVGFAWAGEPGQVLMVTSANPFEGKTTTTANLATIFARDNRRVIVVDGDLRRPSVHGAFDLDHKNGLSNLLADPRLAVESKLFETTVPNVRLLPAGPIPPNPAELLGSARFKQVLKELRGLADLVVIDTPPILGTVDSLVIGGLVDGAILVTAGGETRIGALAKAAESLERGSVRVLGVVLNKVKRGQTGYYSHYYGQTESKSPDHARATSVQPDAPRLTEEHSPVGRVQVLAAKD